MLLGQVQLLLVMFSCCLSRFTYCLYMFSSCLYRFSSCYCFPCFVEALKFSERRVRFCVCSCFSCFTQNAHCPPPFRQLFVSSKQTVCRLKRKSNETTDTKSISLKTHRNYDLFSQRTPVLILTVSLGIHQSLAPSLCSSLWVKYGDHCSWFFWCVCVLSLIHIWRCRRLLRCRSRWSPYH